MLTFWIGLLLGLLIGAPLGLLMAALCFASKQNDIYEQAIERRKNQWPT